MGRVPHIVYVVTSSMTADVLLRGQLGFMRESGWHVTLVSAPGDCLDGVARRECVDVLTVPMKRRPAPLHDIVALIRLARMLKRLGPDIINYSTPKAGLLCSMASWWVNIPIRVYVLRGLRSEGVSGVSGIVYRSFERLSSFFSTQVVCVSPSLRQTAIRHNAIHSAKAIVIGNGSSNGIDCNRFQLSDEAVAAGRQLRTRLGIPQDCLVIGFIGRLVRDKGVPELVAAFQDVIVEFPDSHLLLVGPQEVGDAISELVRHEIESSPQIHWCGPITDTVSVYGAIDVVALPTHREGLPNVALEAAAMEKPLVTTDATGAVDAVQDEVTGLVVEVGNATAIVQALTRYLSDHELRRSHGVAGRAWVVEKFAASQLWHRLESQFRSWLPEAHMQKNDSPLAVHQRGKP